MSSSIPTAKAQSNQKPEPDAGEVSKTATAPAPALLEEDDEFEDFPVEGRLEKQRCSYGILINQANTVSIDWPTEDTEVPGGTTHLWEESWDDDDENEDFSKQLKYVQLWSLHGPRSRPDIDKQSQRRIKEGRG